MLERNHHRWNETFKDEDTGEEVTVERDELISTDTTEEERNLMENVAASADKISTEALRAFIDKTRAFWPRSLDEVYMELVRRGDESWACTIDSPAMLQELCDKGIKEAAEQLYQKYRYGDEKNGIFIDKKQAKELYDLAEWDDYDPNEESDDECEVVESDYCLQGDPAELDKVEHDIRVLAEKFGVLDNGLGGMYVPFDILFKKLVGSSYYEGNITKMKRLTANSLRLHAESSASEPLLYALKRYYPQIEVNCLIDGNGFGEAGIAVDE
jgi:hypothetical protein